MKQVTITINNMEALKSLDVIASQLLEKLPEMIEAGTLYGNDLFERFIQYSIIINTVMLFCFLIVIALCIYAIRYSRSLNDSGDRFGIIMISTVVLVLFVLFSIGNIVSLVRIKYIPELYLIEYFK